MEFTKIPLGNFHGTTLLKYAAFLSIHVVLMLSFYHSLSLYDCTIFISETCNRLQRWLIFYRRLHAYFIAMHKNCLVCVNLLNNAIRLDLDILIQYYSTAFVKFSMSIPLHAKGYYCLKSYNMLSYLLMQ